MLLPITRQMKNVGLPVPVHSAEEIPPLDVNGEVLTFLEPVRLDGWCEYTGECFRVTGNIEARYTTQCARCLQPVTAEMTVPVSEEFAQQPDDQHPDRYVYEDDVLDLGRMVTDNIFLNTPMRHLCRQDCLGLCPVCGTDRNEHPCGCVQPETPTKKPFEALKDIIKDEKV